jgi:S-adenosyl-L-methionine hydrolase (adenosine-forming)
LAIGIRHSIITLLTDFGAQDYFVGAMKGIILSINPEANIVDISHDIPPQDIEAAAFNLLGCYQTFPAGTVHVAVVDPGVGSDRKPIVIKCAQQYFVGPDNGLFSWICDREQDWQAFQLTKSEFFRQPVSHTFHGRDIFAPIAAVLCKGIPISELGEAVEDIVRLEPLEPKRIDDGTIEGRVIHIDRFGNCITNLRPADLSANGDATWKLTIRGREISSFLKFFAEEQEIDIFCIVGSAGFLEIAARNRSAAQILNVQRNEPLSFVSAPLSRIRARLD